SLSLSISSFFLAIAFSFFISSFFHYLFVLPLPSPFLISCAMRRGMRERERELNVCSLLHAFSFTQDTRPDVLILFDLYRKTKNIICAQSLWHRLHRRY